MLKKIAIGLLVLLFLGVLAYVGMVIVLMQSLGDDGDPPVSELVAQQAVLSTENPRIEFDVDVYVDDRTVSAEDTIVLRVTHVENGTTPRAVATTITDRAGSDLVTLELLESFGAEPVEIEWSMYAETDDGSEPVLSVSHDGQPVLAPLLGFLYLDLPVGSDTDPYDVALVAQSLATDFLVTVGDEGQAAGAPIEVSSEDRSFTTSWEPGRTYELNMSEVGLCDDFPCRVVLEFSRSTLVEPVRVTFRVERYDGSSMDK